MNAKAIERKVHSLIANQLSLGEEEILSNSSFSEDLGADTLDLLEFIMALEEEFDIEIADEDVDGFVTLQDVIRYLENKLK